MKMNIFLTCISVAMASLIGYLVYTFEEGQKGDILCSIGSAICMTSILIPMMGLHYDSGRLGVNIRVMCLAFLLLFLISHVCFLVVGINESYYIVTNGIILLIYWSVFYKMQGMKEI